MPDQTQPRVGQVWEWTREGYQPRTMPITDIHVIIDDGSAWGRTFMGAETWDAEVEGGRLRLVAHADGTPATPAGGGEMRHDGDGNPISLVALCRQEPEWAQSRILALEGKLATALTRAEQAERDRLVALTAAERAVTAAKEAVVEAAMARDDCADPDRIDDLDAALEVACTALRTARARLAEVEGAAK